MFIFERLAKKAVIGCILCCVLLSGTVAGMPVALDTHQNPTNSDVTDRDSTKAVDQTDRKPEYEVTVARVNDNPDQVRFTVTITDTKSLDNIELRLSDGENGAISADSTDGFEESGLRAGRIYEWDDETETPSLTIVQSVPRGNEGLSSADAVIVETPQIGISSPDIVLHKGDGYEEIYSAGILGLGPQQVTGPNGTQTGVASEAYTAVGDVALDRVSRNGTEFWVVSVGDATVDAEGIATMMGSSQKYLAGRAPSEVSIFAVGDRLQIGLGAGFTNRYDPVMIVSADESMTGPDNTWLHEYVHVQQSPISTTRGSNWWTEAIAEYQTARVAPAVTNTSPAESYYHLVRGAENTEPLRVDDPPTVESSYERGSFVLLSLSIRIAEATGGDKTVQDVIGILYRPTHYSESEITRVVANQSKESVARWFEDAVRSTSLPQKPEYQEYLDLPSVPAAINPVATLTPEPTATATPTASPSPATTTVGWESPTQAQGPLSPLVPVLALLILALFLCREERL